MCIKPYVQTCLCIIQRHVVLVGSCKCTLYLRWFIIPHYFYKAQNLVIDTRVRTCNETQLRDDIVFFFFFFPNTKPQKFREDHYRIMLWWHVVFFSIHVCIYNCPVDRKKLSKKKKRSASTRCLVHPSRITPGRRHISTGLLTSNSVARNVQSDIKYKFIRILARNHLWPCLPKSTGRYSVPHRRGDRDSV